MSKLVCRVTLEIHFCISDSLLICKFFNFESNKASSCQKLNFLNKNSVIHQQKKRLPRPLINIFYLYNAPIKLSSDFLA